jgi:hypothetical protein
VIDERDVAERKYCCEGAALVELGINDDACNEVLVFRLGKRVVDDDGGRLCIDELKSEPLDGTFAKGDERVKSAAACRPPVNDVFSALA